MQTDAPAQANLRPCWCLKLDFNNWTSMHLRLLGCSWTTGWKRNHANQHIDGSELTGNLIPASLFSPFHSTVSSFLSLCLIVSMMCHAVMQTDSGPTQNKSNSRVRKGASQLCANYDVVQSEMWKWHCIRVCDCLQLLHSSIAPPPPPPSAFTEAVLINVLSDGRDRHQSC